MVSVPVLLRVLILAPGLYLAACTAFPGPQRAAVADQPVVLHVAAVPNLGWMTVRPKQVRVGGVVTISGQTHGFVQFLPPFIVVQSASRHTVTRGPGPCGGTQHEPVASYTIPGGGSGGKGTRQYPPAGTPWKVSFRIPARMQSSTPGGQSIQVPTPAGRYVIDATGVGLDFCTLPTKSSSAFSVGRVQVLP